MSTTFLWKFKLIFVLFYSVTVASLSYIENGSSTYFIFICFIKFIFLLGGIMGPKGLDFKHKEVININDGKRLGFVQDVTANLESGMITSIIVPGGNKILSIFSSGNDIVIPWENVKCIGDDVILVEI